MSSRPAMRSEMTVETRMTLLEHDADRFEKTLGTIQRLITGILVSTATASLLLAINILVQTQE